MNLDLDFDVDNSDGIENMVQNAGRFFSQPVPEGRGGSYSPSAKKGR